MNHIGEQIDLEDIFASLESWLSNESQVIVLQEDMGQLRAVLAKQRFDLVLLLVNLDQGANSFLLHH